MGKNVFMSVVIRVHPFIITPGTLRPSYFRAPALHLMKTDVLLSGCIGVRAIFCQGGR